MLGSQETHQKISVEDQSSDEEPELDTSEEKRQDVVAMSSGKGELAIPLMSSTDVEYGSMLPSDEMRKPRRKREKFTEGYVLVFVKETPIYKLSIRKGKLVADKKPGPYHFYGNSWYTPVLDCIMGTPKPMKEKTWNKSKDDMLYKLNEPGVRYTLKEAWDDLHIYAVITVSRRRVKEYMDVHDFDLEIDAELCVKYARKSLPNFMLAHNTFIPDMDEDGVDGVTIDGDKAFRTVDEDIKVPLLGLGLWKHIHIPYDSTLEQSIYKVADNGPSFWQEDDDDIKDLDIVREDLEEDDVIHEMQGSAKTGAKPKGDFLGNRLALRAMYSFLSEDRRLDGCGFKIESLINDVSHPLKHVYATNDLTHNKPGDGLEEMTLRKALFNFGDTFIQGLRQINKSEGRAAVDQIREHYGEQVGFYFAFLLHYQRWLRFLVPLGLAWFIVQLSTHRIAPAGSAFVVAAFIIWGTVMLENWNRMEHKLRLEWGMMRIKKTEVPRPDFKGALRFSQLTGQLIEDYASKTWFYIRICFSFGSIALCLACVIATVIGIFTLKNRPAFKDNPLMSVLLGVINAVQITIFNAVYIYLATYLNNAEGHRLESEYYNHLVVKRVLFYVVNSFNSIVYLAFFQDFDSNSARLLAIRLQLVTLFVSMIFIQNMTEILLPILSKKAMDKLSGRKMRSASKAFLSISKNSTASDGSSLMVDMAGARGHMRQKTPVKLQVEDDIWTDAAAQFELGPSPSVLDNTAEIVIQFGYVTLFAIVFPLMPILAIVNNLIEFRLDFWNVTTSRRPVPLPAIGIGVWKPVLTSFVVLSVPSNMILLTFRTDLAKRVYGCNSESDKLIFFFVAVVSLLFIQYLFRYVVPDYTPRTKKAIERQFQCEKYLFMAQVKENARGLKKQAIQSFKDDVATDRTHRSSPLKGMTSAFKVVVGSSADDIDSTNPTY